LCSTVRTSTRLTGRVGPRRCSSNELITKRGGGISPGLQPDQKKREKAGNTISGVGNGGRVHITLKCS